MRRQDQPFTPEQIEIVRWTASLGAITADALALRLGRTPASARSRLGIVCRRGLLKRERLLTGRPALFTPTRAGLRACDASGIGTRSIAVQSVNHLIACAAAAAALERCYPDHRLVGERELRRDERKRDRPLAAALLGTLPNGDSARHYPDMVLWPSADYDSSPIVVEVELTIKAPERLLDICRAWGRCRNVAGVLYLAAPKVERALTRAIADAYASEKVIVVPLSALPGMETGTAPQATVTT
jgi:hypothetical protein